MKKGVSVTNEEKIKELASNYDLNKDDFWKHGPSGKWIISYDAVIKIQHKEKIEIAPPQILNSERDFVRMLISGKKGDAVMWTTGEADPKNCQNKYYGAMAEKRGKSRIILMLCEAYNHGIYSEVEADSFKKGAK
tara:strand:- start:108 stop:512 length:405 start_codon:yes stop_codon:yes gene_type:complete